MNVDFAFFRSLGFTNKKTLALVKSLETKGLCSLSIVPQDDKKSKLEINLTADLLSLMFNDTAKAITNNDLAVPQTQEKIEVAESYEQVKAIKSKYPIHINNRYFKHFTNGHKIQFLKTFAARVDKGKIELDKLEEVFSQFQQKENYSLADIFTELLSANYTMSDVLFDFIWIQCAGKVSSASVEAKGRKDLLNWLNNHTTSLFEIEDCFLFMLNGEINYNLSLISVSKALQQFQKFKTELSDGRFGFKKHLDKGKTSAYTTSMSNLNSWMANA